MIIRELNFLGETPLLYLVATPIGNLEEFTPRAVKVLKEMDYIACEDTRNSGLLLKRFAIKASLISCHEHNEEKASEKILALMKEGKKVAYISDAGYPLISDPGAGLAKEAIQMGYKVSVINGPNAAICALVGSGLDSSHFYFYGFLASKPSTRKKELDKLRSFQDTIIFYESPHRIHSTLNDLSEIFGANRKAALSRELTKAHEEIIRGTLEELKNIKESTLLGEMVIVVEGKKEEAKTVNDEDIIEALAKELKECGSKEAIKKVSDLLRTPKNRVYEIYLKNLKKN